MVDSFSTVSAIQNNSEETCRFLGSVRFIMSNSKCIHLNGFWDYPVNFAVIIWLDFINFIDKNNKVHGFWYNIKINIFDSQIVCTSNKIRINTEILK